ncbi:MAG: putative transcriptional regulator [Aliidongia sp.]|jgi:putative transcriptional regulator|nr:putative transcriptional regulator [Aliidongia sp.]
MKRKATTSPLPRGRKESANGYLTGQLLIAMPQMEDSRFHRSVLYICAHSSDGAMGLVINKVLDSLTLPELMAHLEVPTEAPLQPEKIHFGGPVETARGFVLHSADYIDDGTQIVGHGLALTATLDILRAIGRGEGPLRTLLALGYAGWGPGQLDAEIQANAWLNVAADDAIVFDPQNDTKWERAIGRLGINAGMLSSEAGHA